MKKFYMLVLAASLLTKAVMQAKDTNFVDLEQFIPGVELDIRYATTNNFTGKKVYDTARCFLRKPVAEKLKAVQEELKTLGLGLKLFDGYRPLSIQKKFWELVPDERYVANPAKGSRHNRGAAVDLTLIELATGSELTMPSEFDDFSTKAHRQYETMKPVAARNSKLLELIMEKHGFKGMPTEWWHFDDINWESYPVMNITFDEIDKLNKKNSVNEL